MPYSFVQHDGKSDDGESSLQQFTGIEANYVEPNTKKSYNGTQIAATNVEFQWWFVPAGIVGLFPYIAIIVLFVLVANIDSADKVCYIFLKFFSISNPHLYLVTMIIYSTISQK